jgi:glycosyltransferase involved in cell wall biosynthesis
MTRSVLVTIPYFPPDPKAGGAEMFVVAMVEGLIKEHGWDVSVVTSTSADQPEVSAGPAGATVYRLPQQFMLSNSPVSLRWRRELRQLIERVDPDVVNINTPVPGLGDIASHATGGRPTVVYYHFGSMRKGNLVLDPVIWAYETFVLPLTLRPARQVVCGSSYVRDGILKRFRGKTSIVPPGVDTARFHPAARRVTEPRVLYVGSLNASDQHKRFPDLLEACAILRPELPGLSLSAVGGGDGLPAYRELASRLGVADMVQFHGRLDGDRLAEAYRNAAVLALPSLRETFGMVVTEAMASGLPVVAVNGGGVPDVVDDGRDGILVPPRDPRAMAAALRDVLADPARGDAMGQAGREKVSARLAWEHQVAALSEIFASAAGQPAAT